MKKASKKKTTESRSETKNDEENSDNENGEQNGDDDDELSDDEDGEHWDYHNENNISSAKNSFLLQKSILQLVFWRSSSKILC